MSLNILLNAKPSESERKSDHKTKLRETEGTWLQLLRSCALHLLHRSRFQGAEIKSETERESELIENEVKGIGITNQYSN